MLESQGKQVVPIKNISYPVFEQIMQYLYTGEFSFDEMDVSNIDNLIDILRVADEEFLDDVSFGNRFSTVSNLILVLGQNDVRGTPDKTLYHRQFSGYLPSSGHVQRKPTQRVLCMVSAH